MPILKRKKTVKGPLSPEIIVIIKGKFFQPLPASRYQEVVDASVKLAAVEQLHAKWGTAP